MSKINVDYQNSNREFVLSESSTYSKEQGYDGFDSILDLQEIAHVNKDTIWKSGKVGLFGVDLDDIPVKDFYTSYKLKACDRSNSFTFSSINFGIDFPKEKMKEKLLKLAMNL